jgi:hypothetical protein
VGNAAHVEETRNACRVLFGKPDLKKPLGKPRHGSEGNIKMDLKELRLYSRN